MKNPSQPPGNPDKKSASSGGRTRVPRGEASQNPTPPEGEEEEELGHLDDAVIGRALRGSGVAVVILAVLAGVGIFVYKRKPAPAPEQVTALTAPVLPDRPAAKPPQVMFTDITEESGIRFRHHSGATGEKLLPESMGGGVAFFDFDNDNDQDLLLVNSKSWPWAEGAPAGPAPVQGLYRNEGKGVFRDVTAGSGLDISRYGMGVAVGDYDKDGRVDVFLTAVGSAMLLRNLGDGRFEDVSEKAGVAGDPEAWSTSAGWADIDNDGDLDLFVCQYVRWSRAIDMEMGFKIDGVHRAYGQPMSFEGTYARLYRNEGDGRFMDISKAAGIQVNNPSTGRPMAKALGVAPVDMDGDGWIDWVVANDTVQNFVFHNQGDGTFKEIGARTGLAFDNNGQTRGAMGIDVARFRNNAALGIAIGNFANEMTALYVSQNTPMLFSDEAIVEGVGPASRLLLKFGVFFWDYDLDGRLDLLTANGHLEEEIGKLQKSQTYAQPAQLFWNAGSDDWATFVAVKPEEAGPHLFRPMVGRGSAFADIDGDGDLDVVLTQTGGAPRLLRNDQDLGNSWVRLKLVGTRSNRDAIGAWIRVRLGDQILARQVMPTRGYLSQSELPVTIGLGKATRVDEVEILWPGGNSQKLGRIQLNTLTVVEQRL